MPGKAFKSALLSDLPLNWLIFQPIRLRSGALDSRASLKSKRRTILLDSEIQDVYGAPKLAFEQTQYYFSLNDPELDALRSIRNRYNRVYFVRLLGYFKVKPVVLSIHYNGWSAELSPVSASAWLVFCHTR